MRGYTALIYFKQPLEQASLDSDLNQMLFSHPTCKVHCASSTCIPRAASPALPLPCPKHQQALCQVTLSVSWTSSLTIQPAQDDFCHCRREPVRAPSERMPMLAGKIRLLPNYTSATHALSFPLTQVLIAPGSLLKSNILVEATVGEQVPQI